MSNSFEDELDEILNKRRPPPLTAIDKAELILRGTHCRQCFDPFANYGMFKPSPRDSSVCEYCDTGTGVDDDYYADTIEEDDELS